MDDFVLCDVLEDLLEFRFGISQEVQSTDMTWRPACPICLSQVVDEYLDHVVGRQLSVLVFVVSDAERF